MQTSWISAEYHFRQGSNFFKQLFKSLFKINGTELRITTTYHPQTNGQREVVNRCLQQYLRSFCHANPSTWGKYLTWAEYHYTSTDTATGLTPFQVVYKKPPPTISSYIQRTSEVEVCIILTMRDDILRILHVNLTKAQKMMKTQADRHRTDKTFEEGD